MKWLIAALIIFAGGRYMLLNSTRGLRNNNPGNIRNNPSFAWDGQVGVDDAGFVIFDRYENGVRAIGKVLDAYARRGVVTIRQVIETYAPPSENDTGSYVQSVVQRTGIGANSAIRASERARVVGAIIHHENGVNPFSIDFIEYSLAIA